MTVSGRTKLVVDATSAQPKATLRLQQGAMLTLRSAAPRAPGERLMFAPAHGDAFELAPALNRIWPVGRQMPGRHEIIRIHADGGRTKATIELVEGQDRSIDLDDPALTWR